MIQLVDGDGGLVAKLCPALATPWTVAHQAPLSIGFPRQEYWGGLAFLSPGDLPDSGIKPRSPALKSGFFTAQPLGSPSDSVKHTNIFFFFQILYLYSYYKVLSVVPCAIQKVLIGYLFYIWWWWCLVTKSCPTL